MVFAAAAHPVASPEAHWCARAGAWCWRCWRHPHHHSPSLAARLRGCALVASLPPSIVMIAAHGAHPVPLAPLAGWGRLWAPAPVANVAACVVVVAARQTCPIALAESGSWWGCAGHLLEVQKRRRGDVLCVVAVLVSWLTMMGRNAWCSTRKMVVLALKELKREKGPSQAVCELVVRVFVMSGKLIPKPLGS